MTTVHLVRHGQTNWNLERRIQGQTDSFLTELGIQQAQKIASELKNIPFSRAYSSSSIRARDTANQILEHHQVPLQLDDQLREIQLGEWEGQLYADIEKTHPEPHQHFWGDPSLFQFPGAETFFELQQRALSSFKKIVSDNPNETILLVSHGIFIKSILTHVEGRNLQDFWRPPKMENCCHSIIEVSNDREFLIKKYANLERW
ncbi:histidine phosphatase family protein [Aurantivibrio infirmus]